MNKLIIVSVLFVISLFSSSSFAQMVSSKTIVTKTPDGSTMTCTREVHTTEFKNGTTAVETKTRCVIEN